MRIKYLLSSMLLLAATPCFSQEEIEWRNAVYIELFGNSEGLWSVNYEGVFFVNPANKVVISGRVGYTLQTDRFEHKPIYGFPLEGIFAYRVGNLHYLELGAGFTPYWSTHNINDTAVPPNLKSNFLYNFAFRIGYKFAIDEGVYIRAAPVAVIENALPGGSYGLNYKLGFGIAIGYSF